MPPSHASIIARLLSAAAKKFCMDFHGDHTSTCTAHSGATKAHDWLVSVLGRCSAPLDTSCAHRRSHGKRRPTARRCGGPPLSPGSGRRPGAGAWSLTSALPMTGLGQAATCSEWVPLAPFSGHRRASAYCCAAKIAAYRQQYADNQNISFLSAIVSTSNPHARRVFASSFSTGPPGA